MKCQLIRTVGLVLTLAVLPTLVDAQRGRPPGDPQTPELENGCEAEGIRCFFGRAGGCRVVCPPQKSPVCEGAYCVFGFPRSAECRCK